MRFARVEGCVKYSLDLVYGWLTEFWPLRWCCSVSILKRLAKELLGDEKSKLVWKRIDIVGDIAILKMPRHGRISVDDMRRLAEGLLEKMPGVRSVWLAIGPVEGEFKVRKGLLHLAGEKRTITTYREHRCVFKVDISKVFVTPRLSHEHLRVARLVEPGEVVINMFAGVGVFSIVIARLSSPKTVYSIDINPAAYELMVENVRLNRVEHVVKPILGDAAEAVERLGGAATRVLMPLPDLALKYLPQALEALSNEGWLHIYLHVEHMKGKKHLSLATHQVSSRLEGRGWGVKELRAREVRSVGPRLVQVVVDARVYNKQ